MATTVSFLYSSEDPRTFPKTLISVANIEQCEIKGSINVLYPKFVLRYNSNIIANSNYVIWNGKSYFITNKELDSANQMVISCAIDVLNTYSSEIKGCPCTCVRWQGEGKPTFVIDKSLPIEENRSENVNVNFGNPFLASGTNLDPTFVLITI